MRDDRRGDGVEQLRARIVAQEQPGELVVFDQRHRVTVFAILHRQAHPISKELADIDRITHDLNGRDQTFGRDQGAGRFQLPGRKPVAHDGVGRDVERRDAIEKFFLRRFEQRQVRFVIDHLDVGRRFFARLRALQLDIILIRGPSPRLPARGLWKNSAEGALRERRLLLPRPKIIVRLAGHVHADERELLLFAQRRRHGGFLLRGHAGDRHKDNSESDERTRSHLLGTFLVLWRPCARLLFEILFLDHVVTCFDALPRLVHLAAI